MFEHPSYLVASRRLPLFPYRLFKGGNHRKSSPFFFLSGRDNRDLRHIHKNIYFPNTYTCAPFNEYLFFLQESLKSGLLAVACSILPKRRRHVLEFFENQLLLGGLEARTSCVLSTLPINLPSAIHVQKFLNKVNL